MSTNADSAQESHAPNPTTTPSQLGFLAASIGGAAAIAAPSLTGPGQELAIAIGLLAVLVLVDDMVTIARSLVNGVRQ